MTQLKYQPGFYLAYVLTDQSRNDLLKLVPPSFGRVICHHVTLAFRLDEEMLDKIMLTIGDHPNVVVTSHLKGENIECFSVEINGRHRLLINNQHFHLTYSLNDPAKPVDSNKMVTNDPSVKFSTKDFTVKLDGSVKLVRK